MQYASFIGPDGRATWGVRYHDGIVILGPGGADVAPTLKAAIVTGLLDGSPQWPTEPKTAEGVTFLPVLSDPGKILCIGVNYRTHQVETGRADAIAPVVFTRFADTLAAADEELPIPPESTMYDYEGEVAIVISRDADHVAEADAMSYVAGYALFNDLSARDWQRHTGQWVPGKNFRLSGPFGPWFVPADDVDTATMRLETRVNGEVRQSANLTDLLFDIPQIIAYCSTFTRLSAGDVIVTGTPGGVGLFMEPPVFLRAGDVVEVEATGLGVLSNRMS
jgi:2-keto-4-pentenoate hydratase/2-oxohepta-3-ene-1,7-dioic acid hydratase in catechol pathway